MDSYIIKHFTFFHVIYTVTREWCLSLWIHHTINHACEVKGQQFANLSKLHKDTYKDLDHVYVVRNTHHMVINVLFVCALISPLHGIWENT